MPGGVRRESVAVAAIPCFAKYRKQGGVVVIFSIPEEVARATMADPTVMVASDGMPITGAKVHPRGQGTFSRVLGHYVREEKALDLMTALRKMTLMPAQRLEKRAPVFKDKGRLRIGADADITVFDPDRVIDKATYESLAAGSVDGRRAFLSGVEAGLSGTVDTPGVANVFDVDFYQHAADIPDEYLPPGPFIEFAEDLPTADR